MIPKIAHFIWYQGADKVPDKYKANIQSVIDKNPGWVVKVWDEESIEKLVSTLGQQYLDKLKSYRLLHQKVDYSRYSILFLEGGASVDIDASALKSFDGTPHINDSDFIVSMNSTNQFVNNAFIATSKNNPVLKGLLDYISTLDCSPAQLDFMCIQHTTGPLAFTEYVNKNKDKITILDNKYFEPCSGRNKYCTPSKDAILRHDHSASWLPDSVKKTLEMQYFFKQYKWLIISLVALIIIILLIRFSKK